MNIENRLRDEQIVWEETETNSLTEDSGKKTQTSTEEKRKEKIKMTERDVYKEDTLYYNWNVEIEIEIWKLTG